MNKTNYPNQQEAEGRRQELEGEMKIMAGIISDDRLLETEGNAEEKAGEMEEMVGTDVKTSGG